MPILMFSLTQAIQIQSNVYEVIILKLKFAETHLTLKMLRVKVPRGWRREKIGNRICYESDPPRVKIWKVGDFDQLKIRGRFAHHSSCSFKLLAQNLHPCL